MKLRKLLFIILLFPTIGLNAQTPILFESNKTNSYLLSYFNSPETSQQILNEMLQAIATYIPKPATQTKATFYVDENIRITKKNQTVNIYVSYENYQIIGDIFYKDFDVSDLLIPSKIMFSSVLKNGNALNIAIERPEINFTYPICEISLQYNDTLNINNYTFQIITTTFSYDNTTSLRFRDRITMIDQYYMADADLNKYYDDLKKTDPNDYVNIELQNKQVNEITGKVNAIGTAPFHSILNLNVYDPLNIKTKLFDINNLIEEKKSEIEITISKLDAIYFEEGYQNYINKQREKARNSFHRSLSYNSVYYPSKYYLALMAWEDNDTPEAKKLVQEISFMKNIDKDYASMNNELATKLAASDLKICQNLYRTEKYDEALKALVIAENFCKNTQGISCSDSIAYLRYDCHSSIYREYVDNAVAYLKQNLLTEAEYEIDKAIIYQQQNSNIISSDGSETEIKLKIKTAQYTEAIKKGKTLYASGNYYEAFSSFDYAAQIEITYAVKKDKQLGEWIKKSKLEVMLIDLKYAEDLVGLNQLDSSKSILRRVIEEQKQYNLLGNTKLSQKIEGLKKSIFSQQCINAQNDYDKFLGEAATAIIAKEYIKADEFYVSAINIANQNSDCEINTDSAQSGKKYIAKPAEFQRKYTECANMARKLQYSDAISSYNNLISFFNNNNLSEFGLFCEPLHVFIGNFEQSFVSYGITYLTNEGSADEAFYLLKLLRQRSYPKPFTKNQQVQLARIMLIRDYKTDPGMNAKLKVAEYTLSDSWFKYFSKEYMKQYKKISK